ncbi:hypothetical protein JAB5_43010 [Janthinobacterium sp. HH103]|uniref:DUF3883 domain-containing protein n=1 Tax=unclassified Janthinobacterium TaxID=2610881 RepID=UPI0008758A48|nr:MULTISPECIES: DUF3883 domain-containing protein [unclassified Janthinobacterium]OEZ56024.1 hypothetical protein JAB2_52600 [Janthinobacterium sp. HH100]OEZ70691.1 hypothetical protein JAB5_43010 [Janthinobacterium sp. HH103]QOU70899.1 hypothetical protein JAB4_002920 [Janthinobacterium sp. HH102]
MATGSKLNSAALKAFDKIYDTEHEDNAAHVRGEFLLAFPLKNLAHISLDEYVIGLQSPTFCTFVEAKTRPWANIQGATSEKFGIYFGKTKHDPKKTYRFTRKFGNDRDEAFNLIKTTLLNLIRLGKAKTLDFVSIDANIFSQMFKAKILSLYFPNRFLNVCSAEHLKMLAEHFGFAQGLPVSEYQHMLLQVKESNLITKAWSNPKFMAFLYHAYVHVQSQATNAIKKPRKKAHGKVNFEDLQAQRDLIGKAAEIFALDWEKARLEGAGIGHLTSKIEDRRDRPGYGYDFLSYSSPKQKRFVEVKSVGKLSGGRGYRFFLSENEYNVSISSDHCDDYFFYMVFFDGKGEPSSLRAIRADELYKVGEKIPAAYTVQFELER